MIEAVITGRATKNTSKAGKNWYNVTNIHTGKSISLNLDVLNVWNKIEGNFSSIQDHVHQLKNLKQLWTKPGSPIAFAGISKVYEYCKGIGFPLSKREIKGVLTSIPAYTKFKEYRLPRLWNPFYIYFIHQQWQLDLCFVDDLAEYNDHVKYLLVVIECFSRKIFVTPMFDNESKTTVEKFKDIHNHIGQNPKSLYMDRGGEFNSSLFLNYCKKHKIKAIFSNNSTKAAICERAQRTLQGIMYRYMNHFKTKRYIDKLPHIVRSFNLKVNRTIGICPENAFKPENHVKVLAKHEKRYNMMITKRKKALYRVNDIVRILRLKQPGLKPQSYKEKFSEELFRITKIDTRLPFPRYILSDMNEEPIIGSFQAYELSLTRDSSQL